ncbi:hypothetical protein APR04_002611 [Promicromonospora umidemergens]|nr:hypothetical protein [Promicromonospora umidemergens]
MAYASGMDDTPEIDTEEAELDPFAGLEDLPTSDTTHTRDDLFRSAKRGFVRIRKDFVQREAKPRPSVLAELVTGRKELALDLLLTVHALQPVLPGSPLPIRTWARLLGQDVSERSVRSAMAALEQMGLLKVGGRRGTPEFVLKRENGDGEAWNPEPVDDPAARGKGFFTIPFAYWTAGTIDELSLPGKAMLLVILRDTQDPKGKLTFVMANERAQEFYGFSERTAERGYLELRKAGLLKERTVLVPSARHPLGRREEYHRALASPYSTAHREALRKAAKAARDANTLAVARSRA